MKAHLKRLSTPRTWPIDRKSRTFVCRPDSGKTFELSIPLVVAVRDMLGMCDNSRALRSMLNEGNVIVDGSVRKREDYPVGLFDIITFKKSGQSFRLIINTIGKLMFVPAKEQTVLRRVIGKTQIKGQTQLNLLNGTNVVAEKIDCNVGDSIIMDAGKVKEVIPLVKGATIILIAGKHIGSVGTVEEIEGTTITLKIDGEVFETKRGYALALGKDKSVITLAKE